MRARWLFAALAVVMVAGCGTRTNEPDGGASPTVFPTLAMSSEAQFIVAARQAGLDGGTADEVVGVGRQACGVLDGGQYDVDSASRVFGSLVGDERMDAQALFKAAVEHLCPEHSDLL